MHNLELVGIVNVTPDSFSDGGYYDSPAEALHHATQLFDDGASYLDIGAESTRPGATPLSAIEEWARLQPVLAELIPFHHDHISIDTYHPETVRAAAQELGSFIINDVTAFNNPAMIAVAAELGMRCIVSHLPSVHGQDIQGAHKSTEKVSSIEQVRDELLVKRQAMIEAGVYPGSIILDPGIGFGKTAELNWQLLEFARCVPGIEVMIGYSRKRFLGEHRFDTEVNIKAGKVAQEAGAKYLRVHDVAAHYPLTLK